MIFWQLLLAGSAVLLVYHFLVYPAVVMAAARRARRGGGAATEVTIRPDGARSSSWPTVSFVIAAYNEQRVIARKLDNTLALDYPRERLEILVAADGSTDATVAIASRYADRGVRVLHEPERRGKSAALNRAVAACRGEIVVLSDANNDFAADALRALVRHFADPRVGGVCGRKTIRRCDDREASRGDGLYWRYESAIKVAESALGVVTTADGEICAIRRAAWRPIPPEVVNDDAELTFALVRAGLRLVYEPAAVSIEPASRTLEDDYRVKVRMIAGGFQTVALHWRELLPPRTRFAWMFLSHKLLRWCVPLLLVALAASSVALARTPIGAASLAGQTLLYGLALLGWVGRQRGELPCWKYVPMYFALMNFAALVGLRRFLGGERIQTLWQKAAR